MKSGFRGSGLFPLSRAAINPSKLAPSIPFTQASRSPKQVNQREPTSSQLAVQTTASATSTATTIQLSCTKCGGSVTPVRLHVVAYFSKHLEGKKPQVTKDKRRVKPKFYGEALTKDDIFERIEEEEREKERIAQEKKDKQRKRQERRQKGKQNKQRVTDEDNTENDDDEEQGSRGKHLIRWHVTGV